MPPERVCNCSHRLAQVPQAVPYMLQSLDFALQEPARAVITGDPDSEPAVALRQSLHSVYLPNKVVLSNQGPVESFARALPVTRSFAGLSLHRHLVSGAHQ